MFIRNKFVAAGLYILLTEGLYLTDARHNFQYYDRAHYWI